MTSGAVARVTVAHGPLSSAELLAIGQLYGEVDPRYRSLPFLERLFIGAPGGPSLHAFAHANDEAVGHCAVIPLPARSPAGTILTGKVEALAIDEPFRTAVAADDGQPLALALLSAAYRAAGEAGIVATHAIANDEIGVLHRLCGCRRQPVETRLYTMRIAADTKATIAFRAAAAAARIATTVSSLGVPGLSVHGAGACHEALAAAAGESSWTLSGDDFADWVFESPEIRVAEVDHRAGSCGVLRIGERDGVVELLGWSAPRPTTGRALLFLSALARHARSHGWGAIHVDPERMTGSTRPIDRACRRLPFRRRTQRTVLYIRNLDSTETPPTVRLNAFFTAPF